MLSEGYSLIENYIDIAECERLIQSIRKYRENYPVATVQRFHGTRSLDYSVIDGESITKHLPDVLELYKKVGTLVCEISGLNLVPLNDLKVSCNINITGRAGSYRWHYDRNAVTAILYLNEVTGGETECYPNYRLVLNGLRYTRLQRWMDYLLQSEGVRRFRNPLIVAPHPGRMLIMRGDRCLHSVSPVTGSTDRITIIMSYDVPDAQYESAQGLNSYLYTQTSAQRSDPNYR